MDSILDKKDNNNEVDKKSYIQSDADVALVKKIREKYDQWRKVRNNGYNHFGLNSNGSTRNLIDVIDYGDRLVDNYRVKESWKEDWQNNISDITLHSKLMAVLANMIAQKYQAEYHPRFIANRKARFLSNVMDDFARYILYQERNHHIDMMFDVLRCLRTPASIKYVGYKKNSFEEGIDVQYVKLSEWYPERIDTFYLRDIKRCIWRKVYDYQNWKDLRSGGKWKDVDKVRKAGAIRSDSQEFMDITSDLQEGQVEELMWFDEINNDLQISANNILITDRENSKLTDVSPSGKLPFVKYGYEPYSPNFLYCRSMSMVMGPTQEAIEFMFNNMYDKTILDVMRPILSGGINELVDDYIGPATITEVADVKQIRELDIKPLDLTAFRVLNELQQRNVLASVDAVTQGKVSLGDKTATEIQQAQEQSQKLFGLFNTMILDGLKQEYDLMGSIILDKYFSNKNFKEFFIENAKLSGNKIGTKIIRKKSELPNDRNQFGFSKSLQDEASREFDEEVEIIEFNPKIAKDYKYKVETRIAPAIEQNKFLKKAFLNQKLVQMYSLPQIFDPMIVKKIDVENNRDILGEYASELLGQLNNQQEGGLPETLSAGQTSNQMSPQLQKLSPSLNNLLTKNNTI